ncbi:hypothetical protein CSC34_0660 [Pseudomonas aeruginosa]|nr:hypothetical protein CSC34_0660 [Pseudomonas aeruginosa]
MKMPRSGSNPPPCRHHRGKDMNDFAKLFEFASVINAVEQ